jgi:hypothetical protein
MADSTEELGLVITGNDLTKGAFNSVSTSISQTEGKINNLANQTLAGSQRMMGGFNQFAQGLSSGNIITAFRGFIAMVITGLGSVGSALAVATAGISLLIGAVIFMANRWKEEERKTTEAVREEAQKRHQIYLDQLKEQEGRAKSNNEILIRAQKDLEESKIAAMKDGGAKEIAQAEAAFQRKKEAIDRTKTEYKKNYEGMLQYSAAYAAQEKTLFTQLDQQLVNLETEKQNKIKGIKARAAEEKEEAGRREKEEAERKARETLEDEKRRQKEITDAREAANQERIRNYEMELERERQYSNMMAGEMVGLFTALGSDIGQSIGKGPHEAMRAMLLDSLSFAEKYILTQTAAKLATGWWNPGVWAQIAGVAAIFEGAKAAVASFQTPAGVNRVVPGASSMPTMIMAHGGETVGRGGASEVVVSWGSSPDGLLRELQKSLYFHTKKTGAKLDYNS